MMYASAEAVGQVCRHATWRSFPLLLLYHILRVGASEVCRCKGETNIRFLSSGQHSANDIKDAPHIFSRVDLWEPSVLLPLGLCPITPKKIENLWVLKLLAKSLLDISSNSGVNNLSQMDWSLLCLDSKWWGPQMYSLPARASPQSLTLSSSSAFQCSLMRYIHCPIRHKITI